ncbi:MAG: response regulator [Rhodospirillaceae bacterium]
MADERSPLFIDDDDARAGPGRPRLRLAGYRILVAEDCLVSRLMLEELLTQQGARLVCVDNGRRAIERLRQEGTDAFDILLTDIQMPDLDGCQTAARVRELAPALPVVGLTGDVLPEEREAGLAAGMVEYVSKPFVFETLIAVIQRHARRPPAPVGLGIDWAGLIACYGNRDDFVARLAATIRTSHAGTARQLRAAAAARDMVQLARLAHALKGAAGNLMNAALQAQAERAERAAHAATPDAASQAVELAAAVEVMMATLAERAGADQGRPATAGFGE